MLAESKRRYLFPIDYQYSTECKERAGIE